MALLPALLGAGCAGAPRQPTADLSRIVWPEAPLPPAVRLKAILPSPEAARANAPWWRRVLGWITGVDPAEDEDEALARPFAVAFDPAGEGVYVADPDAARVRWFATSGAIKEIRCREFAWAAPMALALASDGSLYVADAGVPAIVHWSPTACRRLGAGELERPTGIAVAPDRLWIADPPRHQILALSLSGELLARVGAKGEGAGEFHYPTSVARASDGTILVVDSLNFRIVRLDSGGRWVESFGAPGDTEAGLERPKAVVTGKDGTVYVSDAQRDAVLAFTPSGALRYMVGASGSEPGRFAHPAGIDVRDDRIAVADSQNRRIQLFEIIREPR